MVGQIMDANSEEEDATILRRLPQVRMGPKASPRARRQPEKSETTGAGCSIEGLTAPESIART